MKNFLVNLFITIMALISFTAMSNEKQTYIQLETNNGFSKSLDLATLNSLPNTSMVTNTPWTTESAIYSGPLLKDVLSYFPDGYKNIEVYAINNYYTTIDADTINQHDFVLVTHQNDKQLSIRNKGPFWILLNYSKHPQYNKDLELQKTNVWQINKIKANY